MSTAYTITGSDAIRLAERENLTIRCHQNVIADAGPVPVTTARQIAKDDPTLVYVTVTPSGWRDRSGNRRDDEGRHVDYYFTREGYLGPDDDGVEPAWDDAPIDA